MKTCLIAFVILLCISNHSYSLSPVGSSYPSAVISLAINAVHNKLYIANSGAVNNLLVMDLYPDSGTLVSGAPIQQITVPVGMTSGYIGLAPDAMKKKLYVGTDTGYIFVYNLTDTGMIDGSPSTYYHLYSGSSIQSIFIDYVHNAIVSARASYPGVLITPLDNNGIPTKSQGDTYPCGGSYTMSLVADYGTKNYYYSWWPNQGALMELDDNGYPKNGTFYSNAYGGHHNTALDAANKRLYYTGDNYVTMWRLSDLGKYDTYVNFGGSPYASTIDPVRRKVFVLGNAYIRYYDMNSDGAGSTIIDSNATGGNGIAYEPFYNKVYTVSNSNLLTYSGPDSPLIPIVINNGESFTEIPQVTLKFQCANPNFIYVSGNLLSIENPVGALNQWKSCGGGFWRNTGESTRATTLNVPAVLSSGIGEKTIEVWYCGSTAYFDKNSNFTGIMSKGTARITFIESSSSILSANLSRIDYDGIRIDYTVRDGRSRNVNITIQYKTDSKDWSDATIGSNSEGLTGLSASLNGVAHYYIWDAEKDLTENAKDVQIRLKADNGDSDGTWYETAKYSVPDWSGNDLKASNVSIRTSNGTWLYRTRLDWSGLSDTTSSYEIRLKMDNSEWEYIASTSGTQYEIENLSETPVYSYTVRLRTKEGLFSAYSKTASIKLANRVYSSGTIGLSGGNIYIEDFDGNNDNNAGIEITAGTFREDVTVRFERFAGGEYEINGKKSNNMAVTENDFIKGVTIKLVYDRDEIISKGWSEDKLAIYHYDGVNWISIGGSVNKTNCYVMAKVKHFSKFRIGENASSAIIQILPDLLTPNNDGINDVMNVYVSSQELVEKTEIKICGIDGRIVRVIKADGTNTLYWDGRDENGNLCESGIYLCVVEAGTRNLTRTIQLVK